MRYTAAPATQMTLDQKLTLLRPVLFGRKTELFIAMTMYNEDEILFARTMTAVMKNIAHLCQRQNSRTWGPNGWEKVVVCVIADGRQKIHPKVLNSLGIMGVYQDNIAKNSVNSVPTTAHVFEYTAQLCLDTELNARNHHQGMVPVQIIFCLKEKNAKKLNSHRWFFNAFAPQLNPNVCVLLDVGTKPSGTSIYHLWKGRHRDKANDYLAFLLTHCHLI